MPADPNGPRSDPPLYNPRFDHDACGVGFVADAGGRRRDEVVPLALAGLASLAHRGAFAADGASSDGAGVSLPLDPAVRRALALPDGPSAVAVLFLPRGGAAQAAALRIVERALRAEGLRWAGHRRVPVDASALGREARASLPHIVHGAVVPASPLRPAAFERALALARRRAEAAAREAGAAISIPSASSRTVVYKGLVAGERLADFYPDLQAPLRASYALFHQRYATNTKPRWDLAQPFRRVAHNGEINTVRANREALRGRAAALGGRLGRQLAEIGPLVTEDGSDSLSFDEALELLVLAGWPIEAALVALVPEAPGLRAERLPELADFARTTRGLTEPWDGPATLVFGDGRVCGALLDRNGLRPLAWTRTHDGLVAAASEAGAVPVRSEQVAERGRLGPGELLLVEPAAGRILGDADAKRAAIAGAPLRLRRDPSVSTPAVAVRHERPAAPDAGRRWQAGLDAERLRLSIRTMALEGHEPIWSMGDDTPLPELSRLDRPVTDHLRQSFAQVTNPAIDPERERVVMDVSGELGRRPPLLARTGASRTLPLPRPYAGSLDDVLDAFAGRRRHSRIRRLDATWRAAGGPAALDRALRRLAAAAVAASRRGAELVALSDRGFSPDRPPIPSVLAIGAVHAALTAAGRRGETDIAAEAADVLDVHAAAMAVAVGATLVVPWVAVALARDMAGGRGAETVTPEDAEANLLEALDKGLRKTLARMGISTVASYVGGQLFDAIGLDPELAARCFPAAPLWPGSLDLDAVAQRQLRRVAAARSMAPVEKPADSGFARYRSDGEAHLHAPAIVKATQALATATEGTRGALADYRAALERPPATVRDLLRVRRARTPVALDEVEPVEAITRRFVGAAMSLGALSSEAHQAVTLGLERAGGRANTGEGGEDPSWYEPVDGERRDAPIKQVASARFGVTVGYLARADQLEIKIAQGSKPGEGGQLPAKKVTPLIASLRRAQPGQSLISPPPHHDIYSIEDLAQLIADLRAVNPGARIGVKLVAALGVGTIAAGVAKAGADYVQVSGHAGGTGASPLASIKHAGLPWELGVAETHQTLVGHGLRDRVALRTDGGLQTGRDVLVAALLGAEEYGFGTSLLVALGCDMARQCHLDTCPTGIATQRPELRAKFTGTPEDVERFVRAIAEDVRLELARAGFRTLGDALGRADRLAVDPRSPLRLDALTRPPRWTPSPDRRRDPALAARVVARARASDAEHELSARYSALPTIAAEDGLAVEWPLPRSPLAEPADGRVTASITTADRAFGAETSGLIERRAVRRPVDWSLRGAAGQSFGAFTGPSVRLVLEGQANDYVGKGLSGGVVIVRPEPALLDRAEGLAIVGNTCLYGATAGRLHAVGRAGIRFAVRNSGADAVVEGAGAHACEYMTGGTVVLLGPVGRNLGAGMTGGRVYLLDPDGDRVAALSTSSVGATRLGDVVAQRADGLDRLDELRTLLLAHRDAGSRIAARLLDAPVALADTMWLVEPVVAVVQPAQTQGAATVPQPKRDSGDAEVRSRVA